jgi:hypothetical protein
MFSGTQLSSGALSVRRLYKKAPLSWRMRNGLRPGYWGGWLAVQAAIWFSWLTSIPTMHGALGIKVRKANGWTIDYGVVGYRSITTAFVNFVVDQLQTETSVFGDFKYHDAGVGTTAENVANTGIETTDGESRATGTQTESAANAYRSVGTISYTSTKAITEHGLFNDATTGTLLDRTVFSAVNVVSGDSIEFQYTYTVSSGG